MNMKPRPLVTVIKVLSLAMAASSVTLRQMATFALAISSAWMKKDTLDY